MRLVTTVGGCVQEHVQSIAFAGISYDAEVYYDDSPVVLAPLSRCFKFLAVAESKKGIRANRSRCAPM